MNSSTINAVQQAVKTADWICRNQVKNNVDPETNNRACVDMNFGRFVRNYSVSQQKTLLLSSNWISGMTIYALLMLHDYLDKKESKYLQAAEDGAWYLKCLQNTLEMESPHYGAINEELPLSNWCHPRDALSGAWGFLRLYRATKKLEYLKRAELFAAWHSKYARRDGYPIWTVFFDERENENDYGNFQAGSANFYFDLFMLTNKPEYKRVMLEIMDFYIENFFDPEDGVYICYDDKTGYRGDLQGEPAWSDMHKYNDDFNCIAVMNSYYLTGQKKYLKYVETYLDWVLTGQHEDGGFGMFSLSVSSCVCALNLLNGYFILKKEEYLKAAERALKHLSQSILKNNDPRLDGAVLGLNHCEISETNDTISLRVTMYTIYAFILFDVYEKYIKLDKADGIPTEILRNPMFPGLRYVYKPEQIL